MSATLSDVIDEVTTLAESMPLSEVNSHGLPFDRDYLVEYAARAIVLARSIDFAESLIGIEPTG